MPSTSGLPDSGSDSVACGPGGVPSLTPGRYHDIVIKNVTCDLAPGLYAITGRLELQLSRLAGHGRRRDPLLHLWDAPVAERLWQRIRRRLPGRSRKGVSLGSPYFAGFSILYDPGNTSDLILKVTDDSDSQSFGGAIYAKSADMLLEHGQDSVAGPVVVGSLEICGRGDGPLSVIAPGLASHPRSAGDPAHQVERADAGTVSGPDLQRPLPAR